MPHLLCECDSQAMMGMMKVATKNNFDYGVEECNAGATGRSC